MKALRVPYDQAERIRKFLEERFEERSVKNTLWSFKGDGVFFNMYPSGTLLIQGRESGVWTDRILELVSAPEGPVAGCDEVGKGDIFGPLVLCCAVIEPGNFKKVLLLNPRDSKMLKDKEILKLASELKKLVRIRCVNINPERFNELYPKYKNINRLMDDAYLKLVRKVKEEFKPHRITVDKYSSLNPFRSIGAVEFFEKGERDVAVSVASILAREKFLRAMEDLEKKFGLSLPKGASGKAKHIAHRLKEERPDIALRLIKLSFLE